MFPKTRSIETSFRQFRRFCILIIIGTLSLSGFIVNKCFQMVDRLQQGIWVLNSGDAMEAKRQDRNDNILVEATGHIETFLMDFFTLDADEKVIQTNLTAALYLADGSAKQVYDNLKESGYYAGIIAGNITQRINIDSVTVDTRSYPFPFHCQATVTITRPTSVVTRDLISTGFLRNVKRSDHNRHGFLIERWTIVENKDLKVEPR